MKGVKFSLYSLSSELPSHKIPRAFAALIAEELDADNYNNIEEVLAAFTNGPAISKINILTPTTYKQAVKDPV